MFNANTVGRIALGPSSFFCVITGPQWEVGDDLIETYPPDLQCGSPLAGT